MATLKQVNEIDNIINVTDQTAEGAESAGQNLDSLTGKAKKTQDALTDAGKAGAEAGQAISEGASKASDGLDKMEASTASSLSAMRKNLQALRKEHADLNAQLDSGTQAGVDTSAVTEKLSVVQENIRKTSEAVADLRQKQDAAKQTQAAWNGTLGEAAGPVNGLTTALGRAQDAQQGLAQGMAGGLSTSVKSFLRMAASAGDEVAGLTLKLATAEDRLQQMQVQAKTATANGLSQSDADYGVSVQQKYVDSLHTQIAAAQKARQANDDLTESQSKGSSLAKLESYQVGQLADEAHKFFDQIMAGGGVMQAAFYQVPNMVQVMGGFGASLSRVSSFIMGPAGLVAAGAAGGLALFEMGKYAESEAEKLAKLSQQLRATRSDAADMAETVTSASKDLGSQPGWSDDTARTAATSIGSTYNFTGTSTDIQSIAGMARDIGAVFGSLEDGLKAVNTAMEDPKAEIEALYKQHLPGVDLALVEQVKNLQAAGKQGEAYALVMGALTAATKGAYEQGLTPLQQAMENLRKSADPVIDKIKDFSEALGTTLLNTVTTYLNMAQGKTTDADWHYAPGTAPASASGDVSGTSLTVNKAHPQMVGLMQINTDYKSKYDPTTLDGNIDEGLYRLNNFAQQMNGDLNSAAALYNGAKPGSAAAQSYLNLVGKQSLSNLSPVVSGHFDTEGQKLGYSQGLVNFAKLLSLAESSGKQWQDQTYSNVKPTSGPAAEDHAKSAAVIDDQRSLTGGSADAAGSYSASSWTESRKDIESYIESQQKLEDSQKKAGEDWTATAEHITTARIALANTLSPQQQITQGLKDQGASLNSQTGYWRSMAEVVAQFGTEARGTGVDQTALSEALRAKQQQLAAAYNDGTVAVQRQAQAQQAIASVAGESAQDIQHATNYQQAYNEALDDFGNDKSQQFIDAVKKRVTARNSQTDAQQKAQQVQQNTGLQDNLSLVKAETSSIGMNADARQVMLARMQAEIQMHRQYGDVLPQEAQDYVDLTTQIAQASAEYERQQQVLQDVTGSLSGMADELSSDITQGFVQGTSSGMSFKSMLKGVETQIASLLVKFALINPMLNSIDGGTRTTLSDVTNLLSGSGSSGSSSLGVLGSLSGLSVGQQQAYRNEVTQSAMPSSGWAPTGDVMSLAGVKQASALDNLFSGKSADGSGIFSSLGSAVGTIGSYAGIAGAAVGIGTMIYNAFKGLFAKSHYAYTDVIATNGQLATGGTRVKRATNDVTAGLVQDITTVNDVLGAAGITVDDGSFGAVGHYKKGSKTSQTTLEDLLPDMKLNSSDPTLNMALQQLMPTSFDSVSTYTQDIESLKTLADTLDGMKVSVSRFDDASHVTIDHFNGYTGDMATALSTLDGKTLSTDDLQSKFEAIQEFFGTTMPGLMNVTTAGSESLLQQVTDLKQKYQDAANTAASYGVDAQNLLDKGNAIAAMMIANENTKLEQSDQSVTARYMAATGDQQGADLLNQQVSSAQAIQSLQEEWQSYLGDNYADNVTYQQQLSNLEKTQAAERLQIQQSYAEKAAEATSQANQSLASTFSSLTEYAKGLSTSDASPLSVADQYKAANDNLQGDYQAALGGNSTALGSVQSDMQTFLSLSKTLNGGGIGYTTDYQQIVTMLQALGNLGTGDLTADAMRKIAEDQTATLAGNQQLLLAAVRQLLSEIRFQNSKAAA